MNPSTEDFIRGFDTLNAENIIVFPNNGNIILAARQSAKIYTESKVHVVETKSLAQGFAALTMLDLNGEPEQIIADLAPVIENVVTCLVTYSIREMISMVSTSIRMISLVSAIIKLLLLIVDVQKLFVLY